MKISFIPFLLALSSPVMAGEGIPIGKVIDAPIGAETLCKDYFWACMHSQSPSFRVDLRKIENINRKVNAGVKEISDIDQYGVDEKWALPSDNGGDCEDFAILKKYMLIREGVPAESLLISTVLDRKNQGHAVLIFRTGDTYFVLDNLTDKIVPWYDTGYLFLRMQNPESPSTWVSILSKGG